MGKELLPEEIEYLLDPKPRRMRGVDQGQVTVSQPDPFPGKLTGALGIFFLNRSQIVSAHLVQAAFHRRRACRIC